MRLPAISVPSTPVWIPHGDPAPVLLLTPSTFPIISDSARQHSNNNNNNNNQNIPRLNPLHPPHVLKRTVSLETPSVHQHNHQRTVILQRREHQRFHQVWRKPFYGSVSEREESRKELREHLKRQMEEKRVEVKLQRVTRTKEAESVREVDRLDLSRDQEQRIQHNRAMMVYRDENKRLMEQRWRERALTHSQQILEERELLRLNPINWRGTLT